MARIEKTVFISYRRSDVYIALAVYENLTKHGFDVFFDYTSIYSGDFEQIITSNIRARAHFLLILTPTAFDRINEPGDWLRREIEIAIDERRNIIPLFFKGFQFGAQAVSDTLTGKLRSLSRYNGLNVHEDYFQEAMQRVRTQFLSIPLNTVLHPVSTEVQMVVKEEQIAADKALEQIDDVKELVKHPEVKTVQVENLSPLPGEVAAEYVAKPSLRLTEQKKTAPKFSPRIILGGALLAAIVLAVILFPALRNRFAPVIGSTLTGADGMTLVFVPAGEFTMGNVDGSSDVRAVHTVILDAFWIDQIEVTNAMYARCVEANQCDPPSDTSSFTHPEYFGNPEFDNYPVLYVSWNDANAYCAWAGRRLPTEAARSDDARTYPWGDDAPTNSLLNYNDAIGDTTEVGNYPDGASPYGALDMAGNVWEWVADWYDENYYETLGENAVNPLGPDSGQHRVLRGGAWSFDVISSPTRRSDGPSYSYDYAGFRCAMSATP